MTQIVHDSEIARTTTSARSDRETPLRPGVVFVPCDLCSAPVDLAFVWYGGQPQLCEQHISVVILF